MYNLVISLAAGLLIAAAVRLGGFGWAAVIIPGALAAAIAYIALNLRAQKRLSARIEAAVAEAQARRFDRAIQIAKGTLAMGPWLFGTQAAVSALIGQFLWWKGENEAALPYLEAAAAGQWPARVMLAIARWRKRDMEGMIERLQAKPKLVTRNMAHNRETKIERAEDDREPERSAPPTLEIDPERNQRGTDVKQRMRRHHASQLEKKRKCAIERWIE